MSDENPTPDLTAVPTGEVVMEPTRLQRFVINHPRASRVLAIIGVGGTALGAALLTSTVKSRKHHVDAAKDHIVEAGHELSAAVSPTSQETPA